MKNRGESSADSVGLDIVNKTQNKVLLQDFLIPKILGRNDTTLAILVSALSAGTHELQCIIDPQNRVAEEEEENNEILSTLFVATPDHGSAGEFYFEDAGCRLVIPPKSLSKSTSISIASVNDERLTKTARAASLVFLKNNGNETKILQIQCIDSTFLADVNVKLQFDAVDSTTAHFIASGSARIYGWMQQAHSWRGLESTVDGQTISATLPAGVSTWALMGSADVDPPKITISAQGQNLADGDVVPQRPVFAMAIEDKSAIDVSMTGLQLWLNDTILNESDYVLSTNPEYPGLAHVSYTSELLSGEHRLKIRASDVNANDHTTETTFRIAEKFGLDFIANHPNPFVDETTFAFSITDMANHVDLNIYTVSGRLIRSFEFIDITGYHEIDWDGADRDGNEIANGVYYLKFSARNGDEKIERIERLAKLK